MVDTERTEELGGRTEGCPIRLVTEEVLKGGLGRLMLGSEVVRRGLKPRKELDSVTDVDGNVSTLMDLTGDDVGVNFANLTACFDEILAEDDVKDRGGEGEALDEDGARDLVGEYEGDEGNAND